MLTGKAKRDYQREYMRRKRGSNTTGSNIDKGLTVRPGVNTLSLCRVPKLSKRLLGKGARLGYEPSPIGVELDAGGEPIY